jgi:hypothetical protein
MLQIGIEMMQARKPMRFILLTEHRDACLFTASRKRLLCIVLNFAIGSIGLLTGASVVAANAADLPDSIKDSAGQNVEQVHAEGVQIYECKVDEQGKMSWQFREPLATLMSDGKTVGRHFAGPGWEFSDGSRILGKVAAQAPGATPADIPQLLLTVSQHDGQGTLSEVGAVQRLNTKGGAFSGSCGKIGALHLEPYSADYVFLTH